MMNRLAPVALVIALSACSSPAPVGNDAAMTGTGDYTGVRNQDAPAPASAPEPAATAKTEADYIGKWTGVEGMFLTVTKRDGGGVTMDMQWDLDNRGTFPGSVTAEGLRFMRDGKDEIAVPGDGDATGLKWLAGKKDCLIVKPAEGYCRD
ncbi:hypothetical protein ASG29_01005 [Sphingomonas sp. Leaf412]|uniref:hypothetical protein n=1 Tax=Sphingomonas sp. Leaf412 TaxID=1736370 RepID=UPI0007008CB3|nr:hypothetical protein [Sphingomonas sp. Leaf412]KQT34773.1 hypothetical protein ASG29_01005 [Sphingomonas sp. Leaf412]